MSYIICEERCLMWQLHSQYKVILVQINCCLHRRLQNDSITVLKNIYYTLWWSEVNKFDTNSCSWEYQTHLQDSRRAQSWFFYNLHNAFLNCREAYFQLAKNQVLLELRDKLEQEKTSAKQPIPCNPSLRQIQEINKV